LWSSIKAAFWYVLFTVVLFAIFLMVYFPAQFAIKLAEDSMAHLPIKVVNVSGTIWNGRGTVSYQKLNADVDWSFQWGSLLSLAPELDVALEIGKETSLSGRIQVSDSAVSVQGMNGALFVPLINPFLTSQRVSGQGTVKLYDLNVSFDHQAKLIQQAEGRLLWQEAKASYPGPKGIENITLPDVAGRLSQDDKGAELNVLSAADGSSLASLFVLNQGWAGVKIRKRSVDLVGQTWIGNQQPDDVIFQVREKLW
jgi:hypothetical protein